MKKAKLGYRLQQLKQMVIKDYDHIWDCCCDHGYLGLALLSKKSHDELIESNSHGTVHFVDIIQTLITQLRVTLEDFYSYNRSENHVPWEASCQDVSTIRLAKNRTHLVIIAGVGGEKIIKLVQGIINSNKLVDFELLLCPVHQNYLLGEFLIQQKFGLVKEKLVKENNQYYEILHLSKSSHLKLTLVGSDQWDYSRQDDQFYLDRMINHFEQKQMTPNKKTHEILQAYRELRINLSASK